MIRRNDIEIVEQKYNLKFSRTGDVLTYFEKCIAEFFGAPEAVVVDCCSHALELALLVTKPSTTAVVPIHTYMSIPMTLSKLGIKYNFSQERWQEYYCIVDNVYDAATLWRRNSYIPKSLMTLSFQFKKHLPIGKGGMILLDDSALAAKLRRMTHDGRDRYLDQWHDTVTEIGYHYYITPEDAARGIDLFNQLKDAPAKTWTNEDYRALTDFPVFKNISILNNEHS